MDELLSALKAAAEPTRLRLLNLCARGDFTVSEIVRVMGLSQPRISRHLKLLTDAGLLDRYPEGGWVFYRLVNGGHRDIARALVDMLPAGEPLFILDLERLEAVKVDRAEAAAAYFRRNADQWDEVRSLHIDEAEVERVIVDRLQIKRDDDLLDIGTGTGRMLELLAPRLKSAQGIDVSHEMLSVARGNLQRAGLENCTVRHGDMYHLPFAPGSFDVAVIHQVLHFADDPASVIAEAARALRPSGRLMVIDFAPHDLETLREEHEHRRLGFADQDITDWFARAGLTRRDGVHLAGNPLTVAVWLGEMTGEGR